MTAYDTGKLLWTGDLPAGSIGRSSMHAVDGRQYLVVHATSAASEAVGAPGGTLAYVVFALSISRPH